MAKAILILRDQELFRQALAIAEKAGRETDPLIRYWQEREVMRLWEEAIRFEIITLAY